MLSITVNTALTIILLCTCCRHSLQYYYPSDLEHGKINGPVIHMQTLEYETSDSMQEGKLVQETIELYNEHGNSPSDTVNYITTGDQEVNVLYFNANTSLREKQTFVNGQLTLITRCTFLPPGVFTRIDFINGQDSLLEYFLIDRLSEKGELDSARHFSASGVLLGSFTNIHHNHTRICARNFDTTGQVIYQDTVEVNEYNRPVREISWTKADERIIRDTIVHQYDSLDHYGNWKIHRVSSTLQSPRRFVRNYTYKF